MHFLERGKKRILSSSKMTIPKQKRKNRGHHLIGYKKLQKVYGKEILRKEFCLDRR